MALLLPLELMMIIAVVTPDEFSQAAPVLGAALLFSIGMMFLVAWPVHYTVDEKDLVVRFGIFRRHIPRHVIIGVMATRNPSSAPAWSLDRLQIDYLSPNGKQRKVLISPADQAGFLAALGLRSA